MWPPVHGMRNTESEKDTPFLLRMAYPFSAFFFFFLFCFLYRQGAYRSCSSHSSLPELWGSGFPFSVSPGAVGSDGTSGRQWLSARGISSSA